MFGVSGGELIILLLIGLVVLGPERLPRVANQIGGWLGQARRMTRVMKRQLEEELDLNETLNIKPPPPPAREPSSQPDAVESEASSPAETPEPEHILPRDDDDYSPAHDADQVGTGVSEEIYENAADLAVTEADREQVSARTDDVTVGQPTENSSQSNQEKNSA